MKIDLDAPIKPPKKERKIKGIDHEKWKKMKVPNENWLVGSTIIRTRKRVKDSAYYNHSYVVRYRKNKFGNNINTIELPIKHVRALYKIAGIKPYEPVYY